MFGKFLKPAALKPAAFTIRSRIVQQTRFMATVEGSAGRAMPLTRPKATPISHDRATFTIKVRMQLARGIEFWLTLRERMAQSSTANPLVPNPISLERLYSLHPSSDTPNL